MDTVTALGLIGQVLRLQSGPFMTLGHSLRLALVVVFFAGISLGLGQSVVLFANQVRPRRFLMSLFVGGVLYVSGFLFFVLSVWFVANYAFGSSQPLVTAVRAVGLAYAPYLFGFFVLVPYLGSFISVALSLWSLAALMIALQFTFGLSLVQALLCSALGWLLLQLSQRTIGRPLQRAARGLKRLAAGQSLEDNWRRLLEHMSDGEP